MMVSRMPPTSPAWTRCTNNGSNTFGWRASESLKVPPCSTALFTSRSTPAKILFFCCPASISRHCTSGRPASIIVANSRLNVTRSLVPTPLPIWRLIATPFFLTLTGFSCCWRRRALTAFASSASITPLRISPVRARASQVNSAMRGILPFVGC